MPGIARAARRSFCLLVAVADPADEPVPLLMLRADPGEREALLSAGHPVLRTADRP